jgi:hypothetical protein
MSSEIPDAVSEETLRSLLQGSDHLLPFPTFAPAFNLKGSSPGVLDFSIVIQSVIRASEGANLVQLQQAALFLLHAIRTSLESIAENPEDGGRPLSPAVRAAAIRATRGHIASVAAAYSALESVSTPVFTAAVDYLIKTKGERVSARLVRQCLISDDTCNRLGLDTASMAVYLEPVIRGIVGG